MARGASPTEADHRPTILIASLVVTVTDIAFLLGAPGRAAASIYGSVAVALALAGLLVVVRAGSVLARGEVPPRGTPRAIVAALLASTAALSGVQLTVARALVVGAEPTLEHSARLAGRMGLLAAVPIVAVAVLHLHQERTSATRFHPVVRLTAFLALFAGAVGLAALAVAPFRTATLLLGSDYAGVQPAARQLCFQGGSLGLLTLAGYYFVVRRTIASLAAWVVAVAAVLVGLVARPQGHGAAAVVVGFGVSAGAGLLAYAVIRSRGFWPDRGPRPPSPLAERADLDLTFVVPFYNPGATLRPHLEDMVRVLDASGCSYEILPVSDGSTDGSEATLVGLPTTVRPIINDTNHGKGHALHIGLNEGRGRYLGFVDGDGDLPAELLPRFVEEVLMNEPELAIGSKRHPDSQVVYPILRRLYSTGYQLLTRLLFGLSVRDTQTGLKIIRRDVLAEALPRMLEKRFAFDLELLVVARRLDFTHIVELPVVIQERITSTVSWKSVWQVLQDTMAIFYRLRLVGWYDEDHRDVSAPRVLTPSAFAPPSSLRPL